MNFTPTEREREASRLIDTVLAEDPTRGMAEAVAHAYSVIPPREQRAEFVLWASSGTAALVDGEVVAMADLTRIE